jgi:hypothetical protein
MALFPPPSVEFKPRTMPDDRCRIEIVHPGAAEGAVAGGEAGRADDVRPDAAASAQAQDRAGVLGYIGFVQGNAHVQIRTAWDGDLLPILPVPHSPGLSVAFGSRIQRVYTGRLALSR